jgi:signal transduction histidine kinase
MTQLPTPDTLQDAARRFLRRFGVLAAGWTTLLALTVPGGVDHPGLLAAGVSALWIWALASQLVQPPRVWWAGWLIAAVGLELLGPLVATDGSSLAGGASFLVLAGVALSLRRAWVITAVALLGVVAMSRSLIDPAWTVAGSISTVLLFAFGGLALTLLVEAVASAQTERDRLTRALADVEREQAVARERGEAAARLHDSVLQTLTAIGRQDDPQEAGRLAMRASSELRDFLHRAIMNDDDIDLGDQLRRAVTAAADGAAVGVSIVGQHIRSTATIALVDAAAEAVRNAVRHGAPPVRVLLEQDGDATVCWVSDRGAGFEQATVPANRLGVRSSIIGRIEAVGGAAVLDTAHGCEWRLSVPAS